MSPGLLLLGWLSCLIAPAQLTQRHWYFGQQAGLTFATEPPGSLPNSAMQSAEGCASLSDADGHLLFYTNGRKVWDASHQLMPHGSGLLGDTSSTQSALIVPQPGSPTRYYLFTIDDVAGHHGLRYSEIDLTLNGGLGEVLPATKNTLLAANLSEKLTAIRHLNQRDFWLIAHAPQSADYYCWAITPAGIGAMQVQTIGTPHSGAPNAAIGYLQAAPDGTRLAAATYDAGFVEVLDFNPATGQLSHPWLLDGPGQHLAYGLAFSPNGRFLYLACLPGELYQFDLDVANALQAKASRQLVHDFPPTIGALQLAPDGAIYLSVYGATTLPAIRAPDQPFPACQFTPNAVSCSPHPARFGLPNLVGGLTYPGLIQAQTPLCPGDTLRLRAPLLPGATYQWTGPNSFAANSAAPIRPNLGAADSGHYVLHLSLPVGGSLTTFADTLRVALLPPSPKVTLPPDSPLCPGDSLALFSTAPLPADQSAYQYTWQDGSQTDTLVADSVGLYWLVIAGACGSARDSLSLWAASPPTPLDLGTDGYACPGDSLWLDVAQPGATYLWQDSSQEPTHLATGPGTYHVQVQSACGSVRDTLRRYAYPAPAIPVLGPDTTLCPQETLWLSTPQDSLRYLWSDGSQGDSLWVNQPGLYWLALSDSCGHMVRRDSIRIAPLAPPHGLDLGRDTALCAGDTLWLSASLPQARAYQWQDSSQAPTLAVQAPGIYWVRVSNRCGVAQDSLTVGPLAPPQPFSLGADSSLCPGDGLWLSHQQPTMQALWQDGSQGDSLWAQQGGWYWLRLANACGQRRDSVFFAQQDLPDRPELGPDTALCAGEYLNLALPDPAAMQYRWQDGATASQRRLTEPGLYWVEARNGCGHRRDSLRIRRLAPPDSFALPADPVLCGDDPLRLGPSPHPDVQYRWQDDLPTAQRLITQPGPYHLTAFNRCGYTHAGTLVRALPYPTLRLPADTVLCAGEVLRLEVGQPEVPRYRWQDGQTGSSYWVRQPGRYTVVADNACGADTATLSVDMAPCDCRMFLPTAFTPNGDQHNDHFGPATDCTAEVQQFQVYNRWGQLVYEGHSMAPWDGRIGGKLAPPGVYAWALTYRWQAATARREMTLRGTVTLLR